MAFKSSAYTIALNPALCTAVCASPKNTFHKDGPQTVPWYTMSLSTMSLDCAPSVTTFALLFFIQDKCTDTSGAGSPAFLILTSNRSSGTLSKAPCTSEQSRVTFRLRSKAKMHVSTRNAKASLAPFSLQYANWLSPIKAVDCRKGAANTPTIRSAAFETCKVRCTPL